LLYKNYGRSYSHCINTQSMVISCYRWVYHFWRLNNVVQQKYQNYSYNYNYNIIIQKYREAFVESEKYVLLKKYSYTGENITN
jgi:hypothetical protein